MDNQFVSDDELRKLEAVIASEPCKHCGRFCSPEIALRQASNCDSVFSCRVTGICCDRRKSDIISFLQMFVSNRRIPHIPL